MVPGPCPPPSASYLSPSLRSRPCLPHSLSVLRIHPEPSVPTESPAARSPVTLRHPWAGSTVPPSLRLCPSDQGRHPSQSPSIRCGEGMSREPEVTGRPSHVSLRPAAGPGETRAGPGDLEPALRGQQGGVCDSSPISRRERKQDRRTRRPGSVTPGSAVSGEKTGRRLPAQPQPRSHRGSPPPRALQPQPEWRCHRLTWPAPPCSRAPM